MYRRFLFPTNSLGAIALAWAPFVACAGCGMTKSKLATEQLVISDAVDRAVAKMDFTELSGRNVYLDTRFAQDNKGTGFANPNYVMSSVRQQMIAYDVRLQEKMEDADYVVELRIGALGNDGHEVTFGIPASTAIGAAAAAASPVPMPPTTPEISVGRRNHQSAAAKIGLFAYHRETGKPVWQHGISTATSNSRDLYFFGMGPFQRGKLYDQPVQRSSLAAWGTGKPSEPQDVALDRYRQSQRFRVADSE